MNAARDRGCLLRRGPPGARRRSGGATLLLALAGLACSGLLFPGGSAAGQGLAGGIDVDPLQLEVTFSRAVAGTSWVEDFDRGGRHSAGLEVGFEGGVSARHGSWAGRLRWRGRAGEFLPAHGRLTEAWAAWLRSPVEIGLGRRSRCWSPSPEAELLISPHPPPLDQAWVALQPLRLPGGIGRLGGGSFLAYLDDGQREIPYPLLWGMRAAWYPVSWFQIGAQRTVLMGGGGRTQKLTLRDLWDIFLGRGENLTAPPYPPSETDQRFAWHAALHPGAWIRRLGIHDLELFGTYAGEDAFQGIAPRAPAKAFGIRLQPVEAVTLAFAFARNTDDVQHWYHHKIYRSGYTYRGFWIGHPMGGDARTWRGALMLSAPGGVRWALAIDRERRGYVWDRRGSFPIEAGGFWRWRLVASVPLKNMEAELELGGAEAWGGDLRQDRLAEGFARLGLTLCAKQDHGSGDASRRWRPEGRKALPSQ